MKKLNKKIITVLAMVVLIVTSFALGTFANNTPWKDTFTLEASQKINSAGHFKKIELLENIDDVISTAVIEAKTPMIENKQSLVEDELDNYFNLKLNELVNGENDEELDAELDSITTNIIERCKVDIDAAFVGK